MHSRNVSFKLKAKSAAEFTRILEGEIIPLLRRQKGFEDEISFVSPERNEAVAISLWDKKDDAEAYNRKAYPEVLKALSRVIEGAPKVEIFEVGNSTSHQIAASAVN
jgi:heme-degrading monooxygenase HmoA